MAGIGAMAMLQDSVHHNPPQDVFEPLIPKQVQLAKQKRETSRSGGGGGLGHDVTQNMWEQFFEIFVETSSGDIGLQIPEGGPMLRVHSHVLQKTPGFLDSVRKFLEPLPIYVEENNVDARSWFVSKGLTRIAKDDIGFDSFAKVGCMRPLCGNNSWPGGIPSVLASRVCHHTHQPNSLPIHSTTNFPKCGHRIKIILNLV